MRSHPSSQAERKTYPWPKKSNAGTTVLVAMAKDAADHFSARVHFRQSAFKSFTSTSVLTVFIARPLSDRRPSLRDILRAHECA
jgi:hypothetical protein